MLTVISPAKTLDFDTPPTVRKNSQPQFLDQSELLVDEARQLSPGDLRDLMGVSENIAELNHKRFLDWARPFDLENAKQSILAFQGDVYTGLDAGTLNVNQLNFAQRHLRILSGLYGLLRPLDLIQPYRLEMGLPLVNPKGRNLYQFWGTAITHAVNAQLKKSGSQVLVNLASNEYFKALRPAEISADIITPVFKDRRSGQYKVISFYAKKARGQMARFIIERELNEVAGLKKFTAGGYRYNRTESTAKELVFTRDEAS